MALRLRPVALRRRRVGGDRKAREGPLSDEADAAAPAVAWHDGSDEVLLHLDSLCVTDAGGWRRCELEFESGVSGRSRVQFAFHTSVNGLGDNVRACATLSEARSPVLRPLRPPAVEATLWEALLGPPPHETARPADHLRAAGGVWQITSRSSRGVQACVCLFTAKLTPRILPPTCVRLRREGYDTITLPAFIRFLRTFKFRSRCRRARCC